MKLVIISVLIIGTLGAPGFQSLSVNEDGTYQFSYETGHEGGNHFRTESKGPDGTVIGKYSYNDPTGGTRVVSYRADGTGFAVSEDGEVPKPLASVNEQQEAPAPKEEKPEDSEKEKPKEETTSTTDTPAQDEEKPQNSEEPILELGKMKSEDLPPEGFPIGFFTGQFSALRRLPEPSKDEKETKQKDEEKTGESTSDATASAEGSKGLFSAGWQPEALPPESFPPGFFLQHFTGLRRLGEPVKKPELAKTPETTKSINPESVEATTTEGKALAKGIHSRYILPFPSFTPHLWPAASHHHPVYVYSYQQPNAYTYGYYY